MTTDLVTVDDVLVAVTAVAGMLDEPAADAARWDRRAGDLDWPCRDTLAHVANCVTWYAANLARRSTRIVGVGEMSPSASPPDLVDALRSGGALLAAAVKAAEPGDRGCHPFGIADRSGFAAMGCDEVIVHGADLAAGLGIEFHPPREVCEHVVRRLFPWAPAAAEPWAALRWANGRAPLGERPPERRWLWQCAPLDEWDGNIRRMPEPPSAC
jgi:uncharacterized protein (TIGR03083 family)